MRWNLGAAWMSMLAGGLLLSLFGCGGSKSATNITPPPVVDVPRITTQPQAQTVWSPAPATFSVKATGTGTLVYQWRKNGTAVPGANLESFTTTPTNVSDHGSSFTVVVSNAAGGVTSDAALLTVNEKPTILQQPGDLSVVAGQPASFQTLGQGTPVLHYQWKRDSVAIPGATSASYTLPTTVQADNGAAFTVEVSNSLDTAISQPARLTVSSALTPPSITLQPRSVYADAGQSVSFQVQALGTEPLEYQWRRNGTAIPTGKASLLSLSNIQDTDAGSYDVIVKNPAGTATSSSATLTVVVHPPSILTQPSGVVVGTGQSAVFSVEATGSAPFQYQWRRSGVDIPNATQSTYTTPPTVMADDGIFFSVKVTNTAGWVLSQNGLLRVYPARTVTGQVGTTFESSRGQIYQPQDLRAITVDLMQPNGTGGFNRYPGVGLADGTFSIPGVPTGAYYAFIRGAGAETTLGIRSFDDSLDLRSLKQGRADAIPATSDTTNLVVFLQGTVAGQITKLQVLLPDLGLFQEMVGDGPLYRFPWKGLPLADPTMDSVWVTGLKTQTTGPATVTKFVGYRDSASPNMGATGDTRINANLLAATSDRSISWLADSNSYAGFLSSVNPAVDPVLSRGPFRLDLLAQPYASSTGPVPQWPSILEYSSTFAGSIASGALAYTDPYPAAWGRMVRLRQEFSLQLPIPGSAQVVHISDALQELWPIETWPSVSRTPLLTPVLLPKVNGVSLFTPPASFGLTPTLSWTVRTAERPSYFLVTIYKIDPSNGNLQVSSEITTLASSMAISDGLLQAGSSYVVRILACLSVAYDATHPWMPTWPMISAPVYSAVLQP